MLAERTQSFKHTLDERSQRLCCLKTSRLEANEDGSVEGVCSCLPKSQNLKHRPEDAGTHQKRDLIYKDKEKAACNKTQSA